MLDNIKPLFALLDVCAPEAIAAGKQVKDQEKGILDHMVFAGNQQALQALDLLIREQSSQHDDQSVSYWSTSEPFAQALSHMGKSVVLSPTCNAFFSDAAVKVGDRAGRLRASWQGETVKVLNFAGSGASESAEWRGHFARIPDPLVGVGEGNGYKDFVVALRGWIGRYGMSSMAWSFYGSADSQAASIRDPYTMPIFACLHYLIRANGCVRVLETGTARGVSAACLASAVAHRPQARVVTIDPHPRTERYFERWDLWAALPEPMQSCIETRQTRSLEGLKAALDAGEVYDAILLDSIHSEEYVWEEFQLAIQLVCAGGLILIHDAILKFGTVDRALARIEDAGYNVTRLWAAEGGVPEEDRLGLAVVEKRPRSSKIEINASSIDLLRKSL
ncbi:O-methyltransferase [Tengunoibacter tsumagoiensis]|uniref:Class I SAM-dependent methyltransferase n=1 Tax=Tengunoibacter tsumagoiensis TaxID=2014871 RepID=A0A402A735_9CHLR|nr:class I SAM-dependent methyltransferase [Tengunoibacter tsumagoiensis]GCE14943.1 hypothetical protein KTT_48020 [Tengunoibacter tsumagoiensis]